MSGAAGVAAPARAGRGGARRPGLLAGVLGGLAGLAWLSLWGWSMSPYARLLAHEGWTASGPAAWLCRAVPAGGWLVPALWSGTAWLLMTTAMMLPTTLPLLDAFDRLASRRSDRGRLLVLLVSGYMAAWGGFGVGAHALHEFALAAVERAPALRTNAWVIGAAAMALAGGFQFSRLKHHCLDQCRTPLSFVLRHWRGRRQGRHAFALGVHHGLFCIGCCWALMLTMFVVGMGSLGWMLAIGAVMAAEKNLPWGRRLSAPLGLALLAVAAGIAAQGSGLV